MLKLIEINYNNKWYLRCFCLSFRFQIYDTTYTFKYYQINDHKNGYMNKIFTFILQMKIRHDKQSW